MEAIDRPAESLAADKLAGEVADVNASIALVAEGVASRVTLTGMRFGRQVTERLRRLAALQGVRLEASFWPEDDVCDVTVSSTAANSAGAAATTTATTAALRSMHA